jgi:hypothetical protein
VRIKGLDPQITLFRKSGSGSERLADGALARRGDVVRLGYQAAGRPYGAILSIDGRGVVTRHLPRQGERAVALRGGGTVLLDEAYELDDAPRRERFYFVTAVSAFDLAPLLEIARRAGGAPDGPPPSLPLPSRFDQVTLSLEKGSTR